jgi:RNA-directed DNA polymerase
MKSALEKLIIKECKKHIRRHQRRLATDRKNQNRFKKRTGLVAGVRASKTPAHWKLHPQFNPYYVLPRASTIAHALTKKIRDRKYEVWPALKMPIPKKSGGVRNITIFSIPDAAVGKYLYNVLYRRNSAYLSSYAFAYRPERNVHNAIEHLYGHVQCTPRNYLVEYDFSKFFDTIRHTYVVGLIKRKLKVSSREIYVVQQLLRYPSALGLEGFRSGNVTNNTVGIPQGSTISLFLANVACMELDHIIEREGGIFARYSDDSIILCDEYDKAHKCANHMIRHGEASGTEVNFRKSDGISLLARDAKCEFKGKKSFDFCGHSISGDYVTIRESSLKRIKTRISEIINRHLILYPQKHGVAAKRFDPMAGIDWDLVTCINELRGRIYGNLSEKRLMECLTDRTTPLRFTKSATSFYPAVTNGEVFRSLDGWLVDTLYYALKKRAILVAKAFPGYSFPPPKATLIDGTWYPAGIAVANETRLPSFYKSWLYTRRLVRVYGIQKFPNPEYY